MLSFELLKYAYVKGFILRNKITNYYDIANKSLEELKDTDIKILDKVINEYNLKTYYFKNKDILPRVKAVFGFLKAINPSSLLDVGSGRGVFLFPFLCEFDFCNVTSIDILEKRVELLNNISLGGVKNLEADFADISEYKSDKLYDCVTLLEVLEHIPNVKEAIKNAICLSKQYIVVTVPSKIDNNPEHIHFLTKDILTKYFNECGVTNLKFSGVNGHLVLIARK